MKFIGIALAIRAGLGAGIPALRAALCFTLCLAFFTGCAAKKDTGNPVFTRDLDAAWTTYDGGDCSRSANQFATLINQTEHPSALNGLGLSLSACGEPEGAVRAFSRAVALAPNIAALRVNYAQALFATGDYKDAERQLDAALDLAPGDYAANMAKVAIYLKTNRTEHAMPILTRLEQRAPDSSEVHFNRAIAMYQMDLFTDAESAFADYLGKWPEDPEAWNASGVVNLRMKRAEKAKSDFDRAIGLISTRGSYYFNRGNAYRNLHKLKEARDDYTRAVLYSPEAAGAFVNRGEVRYLLGETEEACRDLKRACDLGLCERLDYYKKAGHCTGRKL